MTDARAETDRVEQAAGWCLFALLFLVCIGLQTLFGRGSGSEGDPVRQATYLVTLAATLWVLRRQTWWSGIPLSVLLIFGWCWLSVGWAIEPGIALRRIALMTIVALIVFASVRVAGARRSMEVLVTLLLVALAINYAFVLFVPTGVHLPGESADSALIGHWRGAALDKNFAGAICAFTVMALLFVPRRLPKLAHFVALLAAAYFLWETQSKTSIALTGVAVAAGWVFSGIGARGRRLMLPAAVIVIGLVWLLFNEQIVAPISDFLAQPDALTGRTVIWAALLRYAEDNWLLGSGYGSFWGIGDATPIRGLTDSWIAEIFSGHNGYLELLVQVGVFGLLLAILAFFVVPLVRVAYSHAAPRDGTALGVAMVIFCLGHNFTESGILFRDEPVSVFLMLAAALIYNVSSPRRSAEDLDAVKSLERVRI